MEAGGRWVRLEVLDLFSGGAGGWSLGLHRAGYRTLAACEIDPGRRARYAVRFPDVRLYDDARTLTAARLADDLGWLPDVIVGSPPCQDASVANHAGRGIDGERTGLFREWIRLLGECRPLWGCAENVPGIRVRGADRILGALAAQGYAAWPLVVRAEDLGAPIERARVWFVAVRGDVVATWAQSALAAGIRRGQRTAADSALRRPGAAQGRAELPPDAVAYGGRREGLGLEERAGLEGEARREPLGSAPHGLEHGPAAPAGAIGAGPQERQGVGDDGREKLAAIAGAIDDFVGPELARWNGGCRVHLSMADGLSSRLARQLIGDYGDAILPQVAEDLGRTMRAMIGGGA